jgi:polyisoprenoid-binding protein YceI
MLKKNTMKPWIYPIAFCAFLIGSAFTTHQYTQWELSDGYRIQFTSKNPEGIFQELEGTILFDENDLEASRFDMVVQAASISTGNGMKNKHAKSKNWFDVEQFPLITFQSSKITKIGDAFQVTGTLTIRDVAKEITFPFTFRGNTFQ